MFFSSAAPCNKLTWVRPNHAHNLAIYNKLKISKIGDVFCIFMVQNKNQPKPPPMFAKDQIIEIFFKLDEFWKKCSRFSPRCIEQTDRKKRHYHRDGKMSVPEIMLIMILFHSSGYRCLKHFYLNEESASIKFLLVLPSEVAALWDGSMGFIQVLIQNIICWRNSFADSFEN